MLTTENGLYTKGIKGYITYPISEDNPNSNKLLSQLLRDKTKTRCYARFSDKSRDHRVTLPIARILEQQGIKIFTKHSNSTSGRKELTISLKKERKMIKTSIPITVRKKVKNGKIIEIQIRVTANTIPEIKQYTDAIQLSLAKWHIKPKECEWSQGGWEKYSTSVPIVAPSKISEEEARIKKLVSEVEDLKEEVSNLKSYPVKKMLRDEREIRYGVIK